MNEPDRKPPHDPRKSTEEPGAPNKLAEAGGVRQYEGGRNPNMQVQRSNRQGSGAPTQQGRDDR